jgi:membrane-bound lytic murein transglycosylase D
MAAGSTAGDSTAIEPIVIAPSRLPRPTIALEAVPEPPADLLARLRANFMLPRTDDQTVAQELAWYGSHPEYIARVLERGERYLHHIAEALAERGMPADLALLPVVESAFDPFAYSRGRASGLWQIIPGTGTRLGLKQNWWYDGRRDVVDSTRAALDYLELLHEQFDGDWLLAVAGYNSGEGNVARAIRKAEAQGRPIDFWSIRRDLPAETRAYVPRLLAIRDLLAEPEAFDLDLPVIDDAPQFAVVATEGQIDLALAAELGAVEIDTLYALNPGINRWATDPDGPHRLLVPLANAEALEIALATLDAGARMRWTRHEIARGESLIEIAARYETTPDVLREINGISGNMIRAGDHLMIPHASANRSAYSQSVAARTARTQNRERDGARVDYRVKNGDSLWSIARRHGVGTAELASWNAMAPGDVLSVGRSLVIWSDSQAAASVVAAATGASGPSQIRRVNYVVRRGDSLYSIAGRFRVTVNELLDWNVLSPDKYLQPGQSIVLYVDVTAQSS